MTVTFDPTTGRVRLDARTFEALLDVGVPAALGPDAALPPGTPRPDASAVAALEGAQVLRAGRPHDRVGPALAAVGRPLARLEVVTASRDDLLVHQGWLSVFSAVLADVGDGTYDFASVATDFVPTTIARLVRLRPRHRLAPGSVDVTGDLLDALLDPDDARRAAGAGQLAGRLPDAWAGAASLLREGAWSLWTVEVSWAPPGRPVRSEADLLSRRVTALDTEAGLLLLSVDERDGRLTLDPATPTDVWYLVSGILPSDGDLGGPSA